MMEKLGEPQTHLALKEMIRTIDEDRDDQISFREVCALLHVSVYNYVGRTAVTTHPAHVLCIYM